MLGLLVQNQSHRAGTHLRGKLLRRIAHQTFFSGEMVSANPGAVQAGSISHDMALAALDLLGRIVAARPALSRTFSGGSKRRQEPRPVLDIRPVLGNRA